MLRSEFPVQVEAREGLWGVEWPCERSAGLTQGLVACRRQRRPRERHSVFWFVPRMDRGGSESGVSSVELELTHISISITERKS